MMLIKKNKLATIIATILFSSINISDAVAKIDISNDEVKTIENEWDVTNEGVVIGNTTNGTLIISNNGNVSSDLIDLGKNGGTGRLDVINGGILRIVATSLSDPFNLGGSRNGSESGNSTGILNIDGSGSTVIFDANRNINIGESSSGKGIVSITNGGALINNATDNDFAGIMIGNNGFGKVIVDGEDSRIFSKNRIMIGVRNGQGHLTVSNGGDVHSNTNINIGIQAGSPTSTLTVTGKNSVISADNFFRIASHGKGNVIVNDEGTLKTDIVYIATHEDSEGRLIIGSDENENASNAGFIDANVISFGQGNGKIILNHKSSDYNISSSISGNGEIDSINGTTILSGNNSGYNGLINIDNAGEIIVYNQTNLGSGEIIDNGNLYLKSNDDWNFINDISGSGILNIDTGGNNFLFDSSKPGDTFTGTVNIENTYFELAGKNSDALAKSILLLGNKSITTVGLGTQSIGSLAFNGGRLIFGNISPGDTLSDRFIETTENLNLTGSGEIQITDGGDFENTPQHPDTSRPLLQQDEDGVMVKLAESNGTVTGSGGNLSFIDQDGKIISSEITSNITQNGEIVANGTYDYRLTSGENNDGLYVNYGLTEVELLAQGDNALTISAEGNTGNAADLSAKITGNGDLNINTDTDLSLSNHDNNYTGITNVITGNLKMGNNNVLGNTSLLNLSDSAGFDMNGYEQTLKNINTEIGSTLNLDQGSLTISNGTIAGSITGSGNLIVTEGILNISNNNTGMSADTTIMTDGIIRMLSEQALGTGNINNQGLIIVGQDDGNEIKTGYQIGTMINSGKIIIGHDDSSGYAIAGTTFNVKGDYTGNDGHIHFNTVLGDDNSVTDKMIVTGNTTGKTGVSVSNAGGTGAQTLNGIELIHVDGASDGEFNQEGRIVAGAYDYTLARGKGDSRGNWYLTSQRNGENPEPGVDTERPEGGSYIANLAAANTMFNTRLHDRLGESQYTDALTGEQKVTGMWMRQVGGHNNFRDTAGQLKTQSNRYVMQMGGDVAQWSTDGLDRWHLGIMAGYGRNHSNTHSSLSNYSSKGTVDGYSTGIYGTWYANDAEKTGNYIDSWLQYSWFDNNINGEQIASESYKSRGITASAEVGQTIKLSEFKGSLGSTNTWYIQPQAQIIWMGVRAKDHTEANGSRVSSDGDGNLMTRLGVRTYLRGHHASDEGKDCEFEPFIEANWIHNTKDFTTTMNGVMMKQDGARNLGEVKAGVDGQINPHLNLWGNVGVQVGDHGYNDSAAMVGIKYNF